MEQKKWQPALEWTFTAGNNKCHHFNRDPTHSQQALCSSSSPNLIYLLWRTHCSESHDQGRHGNSLIRRSRGGLTGSTKSGVLLGMIGLHKWLASQKREPLKMAHESPPQTPRFPSAGMHSAPPSASGQMTGLQELDMSHLTDNNALD